ncbi:ATP-binding protein [Streptomyces sp. NPDC087420]|uniref:ATP-binding protein n=1 Tax=Streptomyces sp. NPDC087420 TaxID=3365785 RepID=UPI003838C54C
MDPMSRGAEEHGHDGEPAAASTDEQPPAREPLTPALGHLKGAGPATPARARTVQLISGDFLLTVNPVDGTEIEPCPPGRKPAAPIRRSATERTDLQRAGRPPVPAGPAAPPLPLLERGAEHKELVELLGRGRSVRLTGQPGSGRTALIEAVGAECADLAPDGVVRLSGHRRTTTELLYDLYAAVYRIELSRPDRAALLERVRDIGAVVLLDDLEIGGEALDELLAATPECAYLLATAPDADPPSATARLHEVLLGGIGRGGSLELMERAVDRPLTDEEANWAGDLWFESEGLPLRFVQAGALLRQRDVLRGASAEALDEFEPFAETTGDVPLVIRLGAPDGYDPPLPTVGEGAAPAALLASRLSESARATLRFAVALGGEVPHQAHLPALIGDTHADAALGELMACALISPVGTRYRLATGVAVQLEAVGYGEDAVSHAHTAAQHYAWWSAHPSVTPERAAAEADAILAAMAPLVTSQEAGHASAAVLLARSAAPAFLAGLHWGAWERALRSGSEAARLAGEVAEEAYFHHELGVLALCVGNLERARAELEASIGMRGAVADRSGTVAGRRALALVTDREGGLTGIPGLSGFGVAGNAFGARTTPQGDATPPTPKALALGGGSGVVAALPALPPGGGDNQAGGNNMLVTRQDTPVGGTPSVGAPPAPHRRRRRSVLGGARRNLVAAGTGAVLAAVLGTVVTLGATSNNDNNQLDHGTPGQSVDPEDGDGGVPQDQPDAGSTNRPGGGNAAVPGEAGPPSPTGTGTASGSPTTTKSPSPTTSSTATDPDDDDPSTPTKSPTKSPSHPTTPSDTPTDPPSETPSDTPTETPTETPSSDATPPTASSSQPSLSAGTPSGTPGGVIA